MANGSFLKFNARASQDAVVVWCAVVATLVLPMALTPLLKLEWQGPKIVLPGCAIHGTRVSPDLCSKGGCASIASLGQLPVTKRLCSATQ